MEADVGNQQRSLLFLASNQCSILRRRDREVRRVYRILRPDETRRGISIGLSFGGSRENVGMSWREAQMSGECKYCCASSPRPARGRRHLITGVSASDTVAVVIMQADEQCQR